MTPIPVMDWQMMRDYALLAPHIKPTTGNIFFVHATLGNTTNPGTSSVAPLSTIDAAYNLCTANHGDIVVVMPGHAENITAATSLVMDVAGVQIIGLGQAATRPVLTFTAVGSNIPISAANNRISNIVFSAGIASITAGITVSAASVEIDNCLWTFGATTFSFIVDILTTVGATYLEVHHNVFNSEVAGATATRAITMLGLLKPKILDNVFYGTWTDAVIFGVTTLSSQCLIGRNVIYNSDTGGYNGIDGGNGLATTGMLFDNRITTLYPSPLNRMCRITNMTACGNLAANTVAECAGWNSLLTAASSV